MAEGKLRNVVQTLTTVCTRTRLTVQEDIVACLHSGSA